MNSYLQRAQTLPGALELEIAVSVGKEIKNQSQLTVLKVGIANSVYPYM